MARKTGDLLSAVRLALLMIAAACAATAQAVAPAAHPHENLNAVVWMQTSAEYHAAAVQAYRAAEANLVRALKDTSWTAALEQRAGNFASLPPAVILDLDETVLDNSSFQARLAMENKTYSEEIWGAWVAEKKAGLVPGARDFLQAAHAHGVGLFYVTNRVCDASKADDPTALLLRALFVPKGELMCKTKAGDPSDKSERRAYVARGHRVLLLIGDDFNDFVSLTKEQSTVEGRHAAVNAYRSYWGERWFMLPNPTYGSWERAVGYGVQQKRGALRK